jgi:hypothetical protein
MRKVCVAIGARGEGGGGRVIYDGAVRRDLLPLLIADPKSATTDLAPKQVSQLARVVREKFGNEEAEV